MDSLENMCYKTIAKQITNAPPYIQELVMRRTRREMKKGLKKKITKTIGQELREIPSTVADDILRQLIESRTGNIQNEYFTSRSPYILEYILIVTSKVADLINDRETRHLNEIYDLRMAASRYETTYDSDMCSDNDYGAIEAFTF